MIVSFHDQGTADVYHERNTRKARRTCPRELWTIARRKLDYLKDAGKLRDLGAPPGNRLQSLEGDRDGQYSIRINDQYRICFIWTRRGPAEVKIDDYHD